jgi:hypothetical protein
MTFTKAVMSIINIFLVFIIISDGGTIRLGNGTTILYKERK